jgi:DNA-binding transcriptional LysR family regulator
MDYTLSQVRGFVALTEERHFSKAAARLNVTQPTLTRQIQGLERALGVKLLDRGGRELAPTTAGEVFLNDARRIISLAEAAPEAARLAASGQTGTIRLGFTAVGAYALLGDFLTVVNGTLPNVQVRLSEMISSEQFQALDKREIDLALARPPVPGHLSSVLIHREDMVLAVPVGHELAERDEPISLDQVWTKDYIGYSEAESRYLHDMCAAMLGMDHFLTSQRVSQVPTMIALVRAGRGVALVPRSATIMHVEGIVYLDLQTPDEWTVSLYACWNPDSSNPALLQLVDSLRKSRIQATALTA